MLALSRKEGESILVGSFEITVKEVVRDAARLRIAPVQDAQDLGIEFWAVVGREFRIGELITGQLAASGSNRVRIALGAPESIVIMRSEFKRTDTPIVRPSRTDSPTRFPGVH